MVQYQLLHLCFIQLKSDIEKERRQFGDIIESRTLDHRRLERRLEVTNMELEKFKTSLAVAEKQIQARMKHFQNLFTIRNVDVIFLNSMLLSVSTIALYCKLSFFRVRRN